MQVAVFGIVALLVFLVVGLSQELEIGAWQ
jgi:hypothetical protein